MPWRYLTAHPRRGTYTWYDTIYSEVKIYYHPCLLHSLLFDRVLTLHRPSPQAFWTDFSDPTAAARIYPCVRPTCKGGHRLKQAVVVVRRPECWGGANESKDDSCTTDALLWYN